MSTCQVVEGSDGTGELIVVSGPGGTVVSHGTDGGGVVQDNDGHRVVTEVAGRTHLTDALSHLVLVGTILTADRRVHASRAIMAHGATNEEKKN